MIDWGRGGGKEGIWRRERESRVVKHFFFCFLCYDISFVTVLSGLLLVIFIYGFGIAWRVMGSA